MINPYSLRWNFPTSKGRTLALLLVLLVMVEILLFPYNWANYFNNFTPTVSICFEGRRCVVSFVSIAEYEETCGSSRVER